jgi:hypothetical protein
MDDWKNALFHPSTKSDTRFVYNLRVSRFAHTPIRPHADTPTRRSGGCGFTAL